MSEFENNTAPSNSKETFHEKTCEEYMMEVLDEDDFAKKYELLEKMRLAPGLSDLIIDNIASTMDIVIDDGEPEDRLDELMRCVHTRAKFETNRLRGGV